MEIQPIRKLGDFESLCDEELKHKNLSITTTCLFTIEKLYIIDEAELKKAIKIWIRTQPLLQSTVYRGSSKNSQMNTTKYFVKMDKSFDEYNNLEYIEYSDDCLNWTEVVENEIRRPIDFYNGPMWRMKILKIKNVLPGFNDKEKKTFILIFSIGHSMSDGRNSFSLVTQFLNILNLSMRNLNSEINKLVEIPSNHSYERMVESLTTNSNLKITRHEPNFLDNLQNCVPNNIGNKINGVCGRFSSCVIEKQKLKKLIEKMKLNEPKAKLASLLVILISLAFRRACIKFEVDDIQLDALNVSVPVSVRNKLNISNLQMGSYVSNLESTIKFGKREKDLPCKRHLIKILNKIVYFILLNVYFPIYFFVISKIPDILLTFLQKENKAGNAKKISVPKKKLEPNINDIEEFWSLVVEHSISLHSDIKNNCELDLNKMDFVKYLIKNNYDFDNFLPLNFVVSNLGILENTSADSVIKIIEAYTSLPCMEKRYSGFLYFSFATIEHKLCLTISYNEKKFSTSFVNNLKENYLKLIDNIIE